MIVREEIKTKVDQCLWIDELRAEEERVHTRVSHHHSTSLFGHERCSVCTLPYGMCVHTREWIDDAQILRQNKQKKDTDPLEDEINEALNVFSDGFELPPPEANDKEESEEIELKSMQWSRLEQRLSDRIGTSEYSLFAPDERGWHSCVILKCNAMVVFGGFRYKKDAVPHPFRSYPLPVPQDMEFLGDTRIFDLLNYSWHGVTKPPADVPEKPGDNKGSDEDQEGENERDGAAAEQKNDDASAEPRPDSRYGHVAAAVAPDRMLIFGGRGERGKIFCDTWIYHYYEDRWELICNNEMISMPVPPARYFASCSTTVEGFNVYLFGGTDGIDNFGDLWLFRADSLRWERLVAVGLPPSPRYGHCMVQVKDDVLAVVGGCSVSVQSEVIGSTIGPTETKNLIDLSNTLQKRYREENRLASVSGASLLSNIEYSAVNSVSGSANSSEFDNVSMELKDMYKQASNISAAFHTVESNTRIAEKNLIDTYNLSKAATQFNVQKARHPNPHVDVIFLHTKELIWKKHLYPVIKGNIPRARIHFGAVCLGQYILIMGGAEPTGLVNRPIEARDSGRTSDFTKVYALNMNSWSWEQPIPIKSTDYLTEAISIASADVIRAQRKVEDNRSRGLSFGLLNGRTVELAEAEAVLEVCKWRKQVLLREQEDFKSPPVGRWGGSLTTLGVQGQRLVYCGGWTAVEAIKQGDVVVLNMEQEHARLRRMAEEHQANVHREILEVNQRNSIEIAQSLYELKAKAEAEVQNQQMEFNKMAFEDIRSSLPPISKPPPVELVQANATTLWVKWDRITRHIFTKKDVADPASVTYYLYIQTGFQNILKGDRVRVAPPQGVITTAMKAPELSTNNQPSVNYLSTFADLTESFFNPFLRRFNGEVMEIHKAGTFDVLFDDGVTERNIPRHRMKLSPEQLLPWALQRTGHADDKSVEGDDVSAMTSLPSLTASLAQSELSYTAKKRLKKKMEKQQRQQQKMSEMKQQRDVIETVATVSVMEKLKSKVGNSRRSVDSSSSASSIGSLPSSPVRRDGRRDSVSAAQSRAGRSAMGGSRQSSSRAGLSRANTGLSSIVSDEDDFDNLSVNSNDSLSMRSGEEVLLPTVPPPSADWKLVYTGNDTSYVCEGVVSQDVLLREPDLTIPVAFLLQVHGVDYPIYERSKYSDVAILHTTTAMKPLLNSIPSSAVDNNISRKKKEILNAVVLGQKIVQIERNKHLFTSQGISDDYL